ncbi:hypothetical protein [Streptomyces shenzhenensis]|uniref:hypothetical protein n=1 Tax=Streptomyces shenzhenensis TaxID=943815 RepID=UPI0015F0B669|nr:hypothetical protein [Streptomyces shenzhenensis]
MPSVVVRNETRRRYNALAARIEAIADETLPLVESVTGLPLPDPVTFRLVSRRAWLRAHLKHAERQIRTEARELKVTRVEKTRAMVAALDKGKARAREWILIGAQCVEFTPGQPEVVIMPQALWEGGRLNDERFLYRTLAHEPTHLAQYAASQGQVWADQDTYFPHLRGTAEHDYDFLVEGHAYWADQVITTKLLGEPEPTAGAIPQAGSLKFRAMNEAAQSQASRGRVKEACESVGQIIDEYGLDTFNRVWATTELVPLKSETKTPELWRGRFG